VPLAEAMVSVRASLGTTLASPSDAPDAVLAAADAAMYVAKRSRFAA
jgi:PleD family two-component response regulator